MTKTLTEQWRDGELFGFYYVKEPKEKPKIHNVFEMDYLLDEYGVEVLERVPSYDENNELRQDNKYLKSGIETRDKQIEQLEKQIKSLQEQIKEANECIKDKYLFTCSACSLVGSCMSCGNKYFGRYIKKWGVE